MNDKLLSQYLESLKIKDSDTDEKAERKEKKSKSLAKSSILSYLEWRGISVEELLESGLQEKKYFDEYVEDNSTNVKRKTRAARLTMVKKLLRFYDIPFPKWLKERKELPYQDDEAMIEFLTHSGTKPNTKKACNLKLRKYCEFRNMSPTELLNEAKTITKQKLRLKIKEFYDSLQGSVKRETANTVIRFYRYLTTRFEDLIVPSISKQKTKKRGFNFDKKIVDKEVVRKLLEGADLRDSMMIMALFESGINPVDLSILNYGQLKQHLNLDNPDSIDDVALIEHEREKNDIPFLACFGKQTLKLMSRWLRYVQKELETVGKTISDKSPIITMKRFPFERLEKLNFYFTVRNVSTKVGLEDYFTPADFRNSFNTRLKPVLQWFDKELFMGHSGGIERAYDISDLEYFTNEYRKAWEQLFDLTHDDVEYAKLNEKQNDQDKTIRHLTNKNNELEEQLQKLEKKLKFVQEDVTEYHSFIDLVTKALDKKKNTDFEDSITEIIHTIIEERG